MGARVAEAEAIVAAVEESEIVKSLRFRLRCAEDARDRARAEVCDMRRENASLIEAKTVMEAEFKRTLRSLETTTVERDDAQRRIAAAEKLARDAAETTRTTLREVENLSVSLFTEANRRVAEARGAPASAGRAPDAEPPPARRSRGEGVACSACSMQIVGRAYVCVNCRAFRLCSACEARRAMVHESYHIMLVVPKGVRLPNVEPIPTIRPDDSSGGKHLMVWCRGCDTVGFVGVRFACLQCEKNYCADCFERSSCTEHSVMSIALPLSIGVRVPRPNIAR